MLFDKNMSKKDLDVEIEIAYDLVLADKLGNDCKSLLALGTLEDFEHCGWCD